MVPINIEPNEFSLWIFSISFFMVAWGFGFWMWRQTLARVVLSLLSAEYSVVICGAFPGTLVRSVSRAASQRLGILRKSWRVFHDRSILGRCFRCFVMWVLEYCSAVWCSAADTHLKLLDRAVSGARFLTGGVFVWLWHFSSSIRGSPVYAL